MNFDTCRSEGQLCGISDKGRHKGWRDWTDTFQAMLSCPYASNIKSSPSPAALNPKALDSWVEGTDSQGGDNRSSPKPLLFKAGMPEQGKPLPEQFALPRIPAVVARHGPSTGPHSHPAREQAGIAIANNGASVT